MEDDKKFQIDFFELAFLAEACIPPAPIARSMFWDNLIDHYWGQMTEDERIHLWEWLNINLVYKERLDVGNEQVMMFEARYNPDNQYEVKLFDGVTRRAFWYNERYYVAKNRSLLEDFIEDITKLKLI